MLYPQSSSILQAKAGRNSTDLEQYIGIFFSANGPTFVCVNFTSYSGVMAECFVLDLRKGIQEEI